jgi:hypothetical protein
LPSVLLLTLGVLIVAGLRFVPGSPLAAAAAPKWTNPATSASPAASPSEDVTEPTPAPTLQPLAVRPAKVTINAEGWVAWAMLDERTGEIVGSKNMASTSTTASLIKAWIGADYLRMAAEAEQTPSDSRMQQVRVMIRDSDNVAASSLWDVVGGIASTKRLIQICGLTDSKANSNWSNTRLSPRDITRMGACIADGRAAGPTWTSYLLKEMRAVRGVGNFGIRKAFPAAVAKTIAIKNGWVTRDALGQWHVNCLAIGDSWTMGVMTQYPARLGYEHGAAICKSVATQLRAK